MGFGKDGKGVVFTSLNTQALGALAADTGIVVGTNPALLERFRVLKAMVTCCITDLTADEGSGLKLYMADGDLSLSEIEESLEANGPLGPNDKILSERALRPIYEVGAGLDSSGTPTNGRMLRNAEGGHLLEVKPRWTFARTKSWDWIIYNQGKVLTTAAQAKVMAKIFGVWVT